MSPNQLIPNSYLDMPSRKAPISAPIYSRSTTAYVSLAPLKLPLVSYLASEASHIFCPAPVRRIVVTKIWVSRRFNLSLFTPSFNFFNSISGPNDGNEIPKKGPKRGKQDWCGSAEVNVPDGAWGQACRKHDQCYATPGAKKESCDLALVGDINRECRASGKLSGPSCVLVGFTYGVGLIIAGYKITVCNTIACMGTVAVGPSRRAFNRAQSGN